MTIEVASDHDVKAQATAALRRAYHVVEQSHRPAQRCSVGPFHIN
jgi:hypothetical protein